jgi:hypothetical protein
LQNLFKIATEEGCLSTLKGRHAKLQLSLYADDVVIVINPIKQDVDMVIQIMQRFGDATGMRINLQKSVVATIRCNDLDLDNILASFPGQRVDFPITYLGIPLCWADCSWCTSRTLKTRLWLNWLDGSANY